MLRSGAEFSEMQSDIEPSLAHPLDHCGIAVRKEAAGGSFQLRDARNIGGVKVEVEDGQVLCHALLADRLGKRDDASLDQPAQDYLADRLAVLFADFNEIGVLEQVIAPFCKRRP